MNLIGESPKFVTCRNPDGAHDLKVNSGVPPGGTALVFKNRIEDPMRSRLLLLAVFSFAISAHARPVSNYQTVNLECAGGLRALRAFTQDGRDQLLVVNTKTLKTSVRATNALACKVGRSNKLTAYDKALEKYSAPTPVGFNGWPLESFANFGFKQFPVNCGGHARPMVLTADLCPSHKATDRAYLAAAATIHPVATPIVLAVSGQWMRTHTEDIAWIKQQKLAITFANHSDRHAYTRHVPYQQNFMTQETPAEFQQEIFEAEKTMLENGLVPSIFFRFPGLMSTRAQIAQLKDLGLITLGTTAWLALDGSVNKPFSDYFRRNGPTGFASDQKAAPGRVILTHANGNEFYGVVKAEELIKKLGAEANFISIEQALLCDLAVKP